MSPLPRQFLESAKNIGTRAIDAVLHRDKVINYGLPLCDPEFVLTVEELTKLREDLARLASDRRSDAPVPGDIRKVR